MCTIRTINGLSRWIQPPDAENRMSGGVAEVTGAIPSPRADLYFSGWPVNNNSQFLQQPLLSGNG
jgi:hypothetical protein